MTRQETLKLMASLKAAYPNFYNKSSKEDKEASVNVWSVALAPYDFVRIQKAFMSLVRSLQFPPTVADVIREYEILEADENDFVKLNATRVPKFKETNYLPQKTKEMWIEKE